VPPGRDEVAGDADLADKSQRTVHASPVHDQGGDVMLSQDIQQQLRRLITLTRRAGQGIHDGGNHPGLDLGLLAQRTPGSGSGLGSG